MHELSIVEGVMNMVRESALQSNIMKVNKLKLVIGRLSMVLPDSLQFCFQALSQDEFFRDAVLEIEQREILIQCGKCKQQFVLEDVYCYICPGCGANEVEIIQGRELYLDYYEGEEN
ncbi:MAG: hydrogenase maturation nickel metallochaperone HypA [Syntrophomonas sp.]|nr:hydrogenase maturation nickel metallochaperone HypA [Syntrophomonas sp.]